MVGSLMGDSKTITTVTLNIKLFHTQVNYPHMHVC